MPTPRPLRSALACLATGAALLSLPGCAWLAVQTAPVKPASTQRTDLARKADALFWDTLHGGRYEDIGRALEVQTAAYLENPGDAVSAAHAGWLHIWRLAESRRLATVPATITGDATMSRKYFEEAVRLNPSEARYAGFLAGARLAEGTIHRDERTVRGGYYALRDAIDAWPEFNLFTAGYVLSRLPADSPRFREALDWQWRTLDLCAEGTVSRADPDFGRYMAMSTTEGRKRVCWNSTIAPHNFEGFFLNMGDMLVKSGDPGTARKVYANARHSPDFGSWPYRAVLERRIVEADANVAAFRAVAAPGDGARAAGPTMMIDSAYACMGCHQKR